MRALKVIWLGVLCSSFFSILTFADEFAESSTTLGGYGELHWDMESETMDFHRFIFYIKHNFNSEWSMMSEVEIEHNMVGSYYTDCTDGDGSGEDTCTEGGSLDYKGGYVAMEQAFLNYWNGSWGFQGGVILVPAGVTNEYHEPPTFMSVERPEYNKYIIPTTWFDNGFAFYGTLGGVNWKYAMTGALNGDAIGDGIRDARDKGYKSSSSDFLRTLQLSWAGMEGLKVGGSITMNDAPLSAGGSVGVNLTEFNATYSKNNMYVRMEHGTIDYDNNTSAESSSGYYLDLGYNVADMVGCDGDLYVWTRMSEYSGDDDDDNETVDVSLIGFTFKPIDNISIKLESGTRTAWNDDLNAIVDSDVMRMGLGYMF